MQQDLNIKCSNSHEAIKICVGENCKKEALVCSQKTCQFSNHHQGCLISASIPEVIKKLLNKGKSYQDIENQIISFYSTTIMILQSQKQQFIDKMQTQYFELKGDKKILYNILKHNTPSQIFPNPINTLIRNIDKSDEQITYLLNKKIKHRTEASLRQIQSILHSVKQYIYKELAVRVDYKFSTHHQNFKILNNGSSIKCMKGDQHRFALISPSIESAFNMVEKIRIKVVEDKKFSLLIGICQIKTVSKNKFNHDENRVENGLYMCGCNTGTIYNSSDSNQNLKKGGFRFGVGDVVEMEVNRETKVMSLKNLSKGIEESIRFVEQKGDQLHFCICAYNTGTEVEIVSDINI